MDRVNNLKIALFMDTYYPIIDGVVSTVDSYARILTDMGHYSCVYAPKYKDYDDQFSYDVYRTSALKVPFFRYRLAPPVASFSMRKDLKHKKYDIFHTHTPFMIGNSALKLAKSYNVPIVSTFHSKYYDDFLQATKSEAIAKKSVEMIVNYYHQLDAVWAVNDGTAETLRSYGYKGDILVMPNGTEYKFPQNAEHLKAQAMRLANVEEGDNVLLFVGQLIWQKNHERVLQTLQILKNRGFPYRMIYVGKGPHEDQIKEKAKELGVIDTITFLGQISDKNLLSGMYMMADLFFFPSVYDNAPLVLREASVMKTPTLLIRGSNAAEKTVDGDNGFLSEDNSVALATKIEEIFRDKSVLANVGKRAQETIPVPWSLIMNNVVEEYEKIISKKSKK